MNRASHEPFRIGIVGGGFSGAAVAAHLAHLANLAPRAPRPVELTVFERRERLGGGLAYGDADTAHLLNVPAGRLSLWPDRPGHFHAWATRVGLGDDATAFHSRVRLGQYVAEELAGAVHRGRDRVTLAHRRENAVAARAALDGLEVETSSRRRLRFDHVVLALGHGPVRRPTELDSLAGDPRLLAGPWDPDAMDRIARGRRVLLVGTGLTMVDAVVSLERRGFRGEIVAISRRGLASRPHAPAGAADHAAWAATLPGGSLAGLLRAVRVRVAAAGDWRGVIDALRPETARLWRSLSTRDRRRFGTRLAAIWDVHRHRCPPATAAIVESLRREGRLSIAAARILSASPRTDGIHVELARRGEGTPRRERFDAVVLCTGGEPDPARWGSPLVDGLLRDGLAVPDGAGLGLSADDHGFLSGRAGRRLSLIGPARRGDLWESTAVPELARHAASLAAAVTACLSSSRGNGPRVPFRLLDQEIA